MNWRRDLLLRQMRLYVGLALIHTGVTGALLGGMLAARNPWLAALAVITGFLAAQYCVCCERTALRLQEAP